MRPGLRQHRKFRRLCALLPGEREACLAGHLTFLWDAVNTAGDPHLGASEDVEMIAGWVGESGRLVRCLLDAGFIEETDSQPVGYQTHGFSENAPGWARKRKARSIARTATGKTVSDLRREAARSRWQREIYANGMQTGCKRDANGMQTDAVCMGDANGVRLHDGNNHPPAPAAQRKPKPAKVDWTGEIPVNLRTPEFEAAWKKWIKFRREMKKPVLQTGGDTTLRKMADWGQARAIAAIEHTIFKGWQGLVEPDSVRDGIRPAQGGFWDGVKLGGGDDDRP